MEHAKLKRIRAGGVPRVLDLFSGIGGLSLGFAMAGFDVIGAADADPVAVEIYNRNLSAGRRHRSVRADLTATPPEDLLAILRVPGRAADAVDVLIGGPPCQAFARVGRARLRAEALELLELEGGNCGGRC